MDPTSPVSAAVLSTVLQLLFQKEALQEAAVAALLQQINAHNSVDYLQQLLVDVIEDQQERAVQRHEEQANLSKASGSEEQTLLVTARPLNLLQQFLVGQRDCQAEEWADTSTHFMIGIWLSRSFRCGPSGRFVEITSTRTYRQPTET